MRPGYRFSNDPAELDRERVHRWLAGDAYWALGRTRERNDAAIDGSRAYGVYGPDGEQVAFARIVTDGATFAWLCDVYVDPSARGAGVGIGLIEGIVADLEPLGIPRTLLKTADAHGLYSRFGFEPLAEPDMWMARVLAPSAVAGSGS